MTQRQSVIAVITETNEIMRCVHTEKELKQMLDYPKLYKVIQPHGLLTAVEFDELI